MKHNFVTFTAITILALCSIIFWETDYLWFVLAGIVLLYIGITIYGSFKIQANYFLKAINKGHKKGIALTFDDGPDPVTTPQILDILNDKGVKGTFFVIGKKAEQYPELLRRIDQEGHTIGNHSFSHHKMIGFFSGTRLKADLVHCNEAVEAAIGKVPQFFRPPFGVTNPRYADVLKELQWHTIGWSLRSLDTRASNKYQIINKIIANLKSRDIILLHDNLAVTADSLSDIIEHCVQQGHQIVPLSKLIQKEAYDTH